MKVRNRQWIAVASILLILFLFDSPVAGQTTSYSHGPTEVTGGQDAGERDISEKHLPPPKGGRGTITGPWDWVRMVGTLGLVIALIFLARYLLQRLSGKGKVSVGSAGMVVLGEARLTPRYHIFLVRVGRRLLLLGATASTLSTLSEITDPGEISAVLEEVEGARPRSLVDIVKRGVQHPATSPEETDRTPKGGAE